MAKNKKDDTLEKVVSLAKRRGFVFQSSDIYGGLNGCWDYGPLGVEMLKNLKEEWWKTMTYREDVEGLDASILMHPRVWEASGHVENFTDPMIDCKSCKSRFRLDHLAESIAPKRKKKTVKDAADQLSSTSFSDALAELLSGERTNEEKAAELFDEMFENDEAGPILRAATPCPVCGNTSTFTDARKFNLMFKTFIGPVENDKAVVFLRPETAQGIFVNVLNVMNSTRHKLPFGIAQIGKAFRNEINTKYFLFRTREFEQMEMQYLVHPEKDSEWYAKWKETRFQWYKDLGMTPEKLRLEDHPPDKLAHYAKEAVDVEYLFPFGWGEIEGIHNRTKFDLGRHDEYSGKSFEYYDDETKERFIPFIIETSAGASRGFMAFLVDAYDEEEVKGETRTVLHLHPKLAPLKAAILPLVNKDGMPEKARPLFEELSRHMKVFYDDKGAVGRRYRRQDEIGTPFCVTIDTQTLEDNTVTVRERDSMEQIRLDIDKVKSYLLEKLF